MEHRQLIDDVGRFYVVSYNLEKYLWGELEAVRLMALLKTTYSMLNASGKLQDDGSFYMSQKKIELLTGLTRRKFERARSVLIKKNLIEVVVKPSSEYSVQFFKINVELYNTIVSSGDPITYQDIESEEEFGVDEESVNDNKSLLVINNDVIKINKDEVKSLWNNIANKYDLSKVRVVSNDNIVSIRNIMKELKIKDVNLFYSEIDNAIANSEFLRGFNDRGWKISFNFTTQKSSMIKLFNNSYVTNEKSGVIKYSSREQEAMRRREAIERMFANKEQDHNLIDCDIVNE